MGMKRALLDFEINTAQPGEFHNLPIIILKN